MGHLYTCVCDTTGLARIMLEDWEIEHAWKTTVLVRPFQINIYVGTENASRLHTQLEIPVRLKRSNLRVRIYKEWYANHRRLEPSGSIMNWRVSTPHVQVWQPAHSCNGIAARQVWLVVGDWPSSGTRVRGTHMAKADQNCFALFLSRESLYLVRPLQKCFSIQ